MTQASSSEGGVMAWHMTAKYYEACNCELGCPCNMNGFPSHGKCEGVIGVHVTSGERDGVDLTGAKFAGAVKWPGAIHEGNGEMVLFVDAPEEQRNALLPILTADDPGLPWEILSATITTIHGPFFETVEIEDNKSDSVVKVGDAIEVRFESFKDPVSGEPHEAHMVLPTGFIFKDGLIGTTSVNRLNADGMTFDHAGKNAYYSEVEWSSENRMAPAVG
jgi:hypothetical protein